MNIILFVLRTIAPIIVLAALMLALANLPIAKSQPASPCMEYLDQAKIDMGAAHQTIWRTSQEHDTREAIQHIIAYLSCIERQK